MSKKSILRWMKEGQIAIPAALLSQYKDMKLNEQELVLTFTCPVLYRKGE